MPHIDTYTFVYVLYVSYSVHTSHFPVMLVIAIPLYPHLVSHEMRRGGGAYDCYPKIK